MSSRRSQFRGGKLRLSFPRAGPSVKAINPSRRHPTAASQVRGGETGGGSDIEELALRQPVNHGAEEHGSIPPTAGRCLRQF